MAQFVYLIGRQREQGKFSKEKRMTWNRVAELFFLSLFAVYTETLNVAKSSVKEEQTAQ